MGARVRHQLFCIDEPPVRTETLRNMAAFVIMVLALGTTWALFREPIQQAPWTAEEVRTLQSLWLGTLPPLPGETGNAVADDPRAQHLGHRLFFDPRLSANGQVSCATCHQPARRFADGMPLAIGLAVGEFNSMSLIGAAYSPWFFWDGRKDSLWSQALSPLESPLEQGVARMSVVRLVAGDPMYRERYMELFDAIPDLSDRRRFPEGAGPTGGPEAEAAWAGMAPQDRATVTAAFVNLGKAIAAYERLLLPGATAFDRYVSDLQSRAPFSDSGPGEISAIAPTGERQVAPRTEPHSAAVHRQPGAGGHSPLAAGLSRRQAEGLRLFIGKAQCLNCHNGPLFTNHEFHNTGVLPPPGRLPDKGRVTGVEKVLDDPFNCLGMYNGAPGRDCAELRFARTGTGLTGARKTPSLRNLGGTGPFMHAGQMQSLTQVLDHYNRARPSVVGHNEAKPLNLLPYELKRLEAFLLALDAPPAVAPQWLAPPSGYSTISPTF